MAETGDDESATTSHGRHTPSGKMIAMQVHAATRCGFCHYELSGVVGAQCPECGRDPSTWRIWRDSLLRRCLWINALLASVILVWLIAVNVAFLHAERVLGRRPWTMEHPDATEPLSYLWRCWDWAWIISLFGPPVVWAIMAGRVAASARDKAEVAGFLLIPVLTFVAVWGFTIGLGWFDPIGAMEWMFD